MSERDAARYPTTVIQSAARGSPDPGEQVVDQPIRPQHQPDEQQGDGQPRAPDEQPAADAAMKLTDREWHGGV